jgi:hypothetical protein
MKLVLKQTFWILTFWGTLIAGGMVAGHITGA